MISSYLLPWYSTLTPNKGPVPWVLTLFSPLRASPMWPLHGVPHLPLLGPVSLINLLPLQPLCSGVSCLRQTDHKKKFFSNLIISHNTSCHWRGSSGSYVTLVNTSLLSDLFLLGSSVFSSLPPFHDFQLVGGPRDKEKCQWPYSAAWLQVQYLQNLSYSV